MRLKVDELFAAPQIGRELMRYLPTDDIWISDWTRSHANFFRAVEIEKRMMFLILLLIVAVAAFNIVSTLVMAVHRQARRHRHPAYPGREPAQHHGASSWSRASLIGTVVGLLGRDCRWRGAGAQYRRRGAGTGARCWACKFLAKDVYYISDLPSDLHWSDVWHHRRACPSC
jgi:lipoprotein-releasing system permease protein